MQNIISSFSQSSFSDIVQVRSYLSANCHSFTCPEEHPCPMPMHYGVFNVRFSKGKSDIECNLSHIFAVTGLFDLLIATSRTVSGKRSGFPFVFRIIYRAEYVGGDLSQLESASGLAVLCFIMLRVTIHPEHNETEDMKHAF